MAKMKKCQSCGRPSTVIITNIIDEEKRELHLCEDCARDQHHLLDGPSLNLQALVKLIMGMPAAADPAGLTCPTCGLKYAAFRAGGRLGCPDDYDAFRPALEPLLDRIHRGTRHQGKTPRAALRRAELDALRDRLKAAVAVEDYEEAARLRDRIRQKEALG
jgi:protein arginine kinase activator